jgi:hypothetical protein
VGSSRKSNGSLLQYRDAIRHHFVASLSTWSHDNKVARPISTTATGIEEGRKDPVREIRCRLTRSECHDEAGGDFVGSWHRSAPGEARSAR